MTGKPTTQPLSEDEFQMMWGVLLGIARSAQFFTIEDVERMQHGVSVSETLAPLLYPTEYIRGGRNNLEEQRALIEGFLTFRKAIEQIKTDALARKPASE